MCTLLVLVCSHHDYTVGGVPEHDVHVRVCAWCGTDVVVLCAGLPAGTEDVTLVFAAVLIAHVASRQLYHA